MGTFAGGQKVRGGGGEKCTKEKGRGESAEINWRLRGRIVYS